MHEHFGRWVLTLELDDFFERELFVHVTRTVPQQHVAARLGVDVIAEIAVGAKDDFLIGRKRLDYLHGVARSDHDVGESLDGGRRVDIRHHCVTRVFLDEFFQLRGRATVGERTPGVEIGHKHLFVGTEYFDCLAHEVDSTHDDDVIVELLGNLSQGQRIAHKVGHILDVAHRVVVGQDDGVFFLS